MSERGAEEKLSRIAVIGAGVAGCASALALRQALPDATIEIFEKGDGGIDEDDPRVYELWPNAVNALKALDASDQGGPDGWVELERYDFRSQNGRLLWAMPTGAISRQQGASTRVVPSHELLGWLRGRVKEALESDAIHYNTQILPQKITVEEAEVTFKANDKEFGPYDLVIAADGRESAFRKAAKFPKRELRRSRQVVVTGRSSHVNSMVESGSGFVAHGPDLRLGAWHLTDEESAWIFFAPWQNFTDAERRPGGKGFPRGEALVERVRCAASPLGLTLHRFVTQTPEGQVRLFELADAPLERSHWFKDRVVLAGDAAHLILPDLGQGCAMAFEDAVALEGALRVWWVRREMVELENDQPRDSFLWWFYDEMSEVDPSTLRGILQALKEALTEAGEDALSGVLGGVLGVGEQEMFKALRGRLERDAESPEQKMRRAWVASLEREPPRNEALNEMAELEEKRAHHSFLKWFYEVMSGVAPPTLRGILRALKEALGEAGEYKHAGWIRGALGEEDEEVLEALKANLKTDPKEKVQRAWREVVAGYPQTIAAALTRWRNERHPRVREVLERSRAAHLVAHADGGMPGLRDAAIERFAGPALAQGLTRLIEGRG